MKLAQSSRRKMTYLDKENYKSVSVLLHLARVFQIIMYHQINDYMKDKLSKQLRDLEKIKVHDTA